MDPIRDNFNSARQIRFQASKFVSKLSCKGLKRVGGD